MASLEALQALNYPKERYQIRRIDGALDYLEAQAVVYDTANNLQFINYKKVLVTQNNPDGIEPEVIMCYSPHGYISYNPMPKLH